MTRRAISISLAVACAAVITLTAPQSIVSASPATCSPTRPDALGPFYKPGAPLRASVGRGHFLRGVVRSAADCAAIPGARVEFWLAGASGRYDDDHRGIVVADRAGAYRIETNVPVPYQGRPPHIHLRVSADGYQTLVTQFYPRPNQTEGAFDLVLISTR